MPNFRKLPLSASRNLATHFLTSAATLKAEKRPLGPKTKAAWKLTTEASDTLLSTNGDGDFRVLDRETDRAVAALFRVVSTLLAIFDAEAVPNDAAGKAQYEALVVLQRILDRHSRSLVNLPSREQFDAMTQMLVSLDTAEAKAALTTTSLTTSVSRVRALRNAYGTRLGLLAERADEGPLLAALTAFEGAVTRLLVHVDSEHEDDSDDDRRIRALILDVYEEALAAQRASDAATRRKVRKNVQDTPA